MITALAGERFAQRGDSGSIVIDEDANMVGLLFGGNKDCSVAYFTHVIDLFDDFKRQTGAVDERVPTFTLGHCYCLLFLLLRV